MEKWPGVRETYFKLWNTFSSITQFSEIKCSSRMDLNNEQRTIAHTAMHYIQPRETCVWVALWPRANGYEAIDSRSRQQSQKRRSPAAASCCLILVPCLMLQMIVYVPVYTFSSCNMCLTHPHYTYVRSSHTVCLHPCGKEQILGPLYTLSTFIHSVKQTLTIHSLERLHINFKL